MPELPEVEAARRALEEHCVGKRIARCAAADDTKVIDGVAPVRLEAALVGKTIAAAQRKGKNLWLALDSPPYPTFQFGMAGAIYIKGVELGKYKRSAVSPTEEWPSKYSKLFVEMDDGLEFSFTDKRRFAKIRLLDNPEAVPPISELGPDALFEPMKLDDFIQSLSRKNMPIKTLLLDQSFISGIGNWMADEVLYQARIHPMQTASKMSKDKCETLHQCIKEVIQSSLEVGADSSQFPENWIFHSREKKPGKAFVDGKKIDFITVGGRTSAYVPELQKLDGVDATASRSKRRKDKESDDDTKSKNGRSAPKKGERGAKKVIVAAEGSSNKVVNAHDDGREEDYEEEETKTTKRGRKKKEKKAKVSSKKASHASEDSDEEADNKVQAKQGKKGLKQPSTDYEDPAKQSSRCWPSKEAREESTADLSL
ncbi:formamidopyrimidine-DNA glycosylase-like isoform X1 [Phragmites australis]|uniref:formamidopyrimidine-DNA glycosylase-like isoform X1 n=1 Tax=Phragmites australis TaxID=29695 RepID=UPI002D76C7DD|nr:formamidopyrimidine-DNA glycosylase-like isoform X1 [Phragmites australis]